MLLRLRSGVRDTWRLLRSAPILLALASACTEDRSGHTANVAAAGGRPEPARETPEPEPGSGGEGGARGEANGAGGAAPTGKDEQEPSGAAGSPTEPPVTPPFVDEPIIDEPGTVTPPEDEREDDEGATDSAGLPCDVSRLLRTRCQSCHFRPPAAGASISLVTYADLTAPSRLEPSLTVAARSLKRMNDSLRPMPPAPAAPATTSDTVPLEAWLEAGLALTPCSDNPGPDPYAAPTTCTSGKYWTAIDSGSPWMNPGLPCLDCHRRYPSFAPLFTVAGTVFPTAHEPNKCFGVPLDTGATVVITDANGQELSPIRVVSGGNFGAFLPELALPYRAKVVVGGSERVMLTPQTSGDCNACHTQSGAEGARGRVIVP